jgi:hypothetical protein
LKKIALHLIAAILLLGTAPSAFSAGPSKIGLGPTSSASGATGVWGSFLTQSPNVSSLFARDLLSINLKPEIQTQFVTVMDATGLTPTDLKGSHDARQAAIISAAIGNLAAAQAAQKGAAPINTALLAIATDSPVIGSILKGKNSDLYDKLPLKSQEAVDWYQKSAMAKRAAALIRGVVQSWDKRKEEDIPITTAGPANREKERLWRENELRKPTKAPEASEVDTYSLAVSQRINRFLSAVGEGPLTPEQSEYLRLTHQAVWTYTPGTEGYHHRDHQFGEESVEWHALDATLTKLRRDFEKDPAAKANLQKGLKTSSLADIIVRLDSGFAVHDAEAILVEVIDGQEKWLTDDVRKRPGDNDLGQPIREWEELGRKLRLYGKPRLTQSNTLTSLAFLETAREASHLRGDPLVRWAIQSTAFGLIEKSKELEDKKAAWENDIITQYGPAALDLAKGWYGGPADLWNAPLKGARAWLAMTEGLRLEFMNVTDKYRELVADLTGKPYFVPAVLGTPFFWEGLVFTDTKNLAYLRHIVTGRFNITTDRAGRVMVTDRLYNLLETFAFSHRIEGAAKAYKTARGLTAMSGEEGYKFAQRISIFAPDAGLLKRLQEAAASPDVTDADFFEVFKDVYAKIKVSAALEGTEIGNTLAAEEDAKNQALTRP